MNFLGLSKNTPIVSNLTIKDKTMYHYRDPYYPCDSALTRSDVMSSLAEKKYGKM